MAETTTETKPAVKPADKDKPNIKPAPELDPIKAEANNLTDVQESMKAVLYGVSQKIREVKNDPNAVDAVAADIKEKAASWSEAILNNTNYAPPTETLTEKGRQEAEKKQAAEHKK